MEDVRVTWKDFEYNLKGSFARLRDDQILYDMSLVCDGEIIRAHQVVLGCCSPQLLALLTGARAASPGQANPLILLRGISARDMHLILQFVYTGQVVVPQQQLNTFLAAAEDLEILGLSKKCADIHIGDFEDEFDYGLPELPKQRKTSRAKKRKKENSSSGAGAAAAAAALDSDDNNDADVKEEEEDRLDGSLTKIKREKQDKLFACESCDKKFRRKGHLQRHEKAHSDFRPYVCTICEQKFKRKEHCYKHISTIHDLEDAAAHTDQIKLSEVFEAIENVKSDDEAQNDERLPTPGANLTNDNN